MGITLQELFWTTHLDTNRHPLILGLLLVLWTPIGCILVVIRTLGIIALMFALVAMHLVNPSAKLPSFLRRAIMLFIGIKVKYVYLFQKKIDSSESNSRVISLRIEGLENITPLQKTGEKFIIVCNHRTAFGTIIRFYAVITFHSIALMFDWMASRLVTSVFGLRPFGRHARCHIL